jgi:hypothetical protein
VTDAGLPDPADMKCAGVSVAAWLLWRRKKQRAEKKRIARKLLAWATLEKARASVRTRHFLRSGDLHTSVSLSPWYKLYRDGSDAAFINVTSLDRASFNYLLEHFKKEYRFARTGRPSRIKDHHCVLGLLLHTYCGTAERKTWSEMFAVVPATLARTLEKAEAALERTLQNLHEARVEWPSKDEQFALGKLVEAKDELIKGRWGFIDGKNYPVQEPANSEVQNAMYNGWLHATLVTGVACFSAAGVVIWAKLNFYGSWNDGEMSRKFRHKLSLNEKNLPGHGVLVTTEL